jgi:DNA-binding transcriptional LysR family regulator
MEAALADRVRAPRLTWPGLELRHLAAFEAVVETGSFTAAAARLGYTQSAVSGQVAALERVVGVVLVDRSRGSRRLQLTDAGAVLLEHARAIDHELALARARIDQRTRDPSPRSTSQRPPNSTTS